MYKVWNKVTGEHEYVWHEDDGDFEGSSRELIEWDSEKTGKNWEEAVQRYFARAGFNVEPNPPVGGVEMDWGAYEFPTQITSSCGEGEGNEHWPKLESPIEIPPLKIIGECKDVPNGDLTPHYLYKTHSAAHSEKSLPILACTKETTITEKFSEQKYSRDIPLLLSYHVYYNKPIHTWLKANHIIRWWVTLVSWGSSDIFPSPSPATEFSMNSKKKRIVSEIMVGNCDYDIIDAVYIDRPEKYWGNSAGGVQIN